MGGGNVSGFNEILAVLGIVEIILTAILIPLFIRIQNLVNGMRCQLRSDMLHIYYHNKGGKKIRQYELENFVFLYKAYKSLKGNSFIDKIYQEVMTWEVVT